MEIKYQRLALSQRGRLLSFLLDVPALLILGFVSGKAYYLMVAFGDRVTTRGASKKNLLALGAAVTLIFWIYSALLYLNVIYFPWPFPKWFAGTNWMLDSGLPLGLSRSQLSDVAAVVLFATYPLWFYLGTELGLAGHRLTKGRRLQERNHVIGQVVDTVFPEGGAIPPGAAQVDTLGLVDSLFNKIPSEFADLLMVLMLVFDSRFLVLAFTGKWKRFVDLDGSEKRKYLEAWDSNQFLAGATQILRVTASYGYYTKPQVYREMGYGGPTEPGLPAWYNPGPDSAVGAGAPVGGSR